MREIEVKVLGVCRRGLARRLRSLGARLEFSGLLDARFFDFPDRSIKRARGVVRLRQEGRRCLLTVKRFVPGRRAKVCDEHEVTVSDAAAARRVLQSLGLRETGRVTKRRTVYRLRDCKLAFDRHTGEHSFIPELLEIEGPTAAAVLRVARLLGFSDRDCLDWSLSELRRRFGPKP